MLAKLIDTPSTLDEALKASLFAKNQDSALRVRYTNYRGETDVRTILPINIYFGHTEFHKEDQWIMEGWDIAKNAYREYALKDMVPLSE